MARVIVRATNDERGVLAVYVGSFPKPVSFITANGEVVAAEEGVGHRLGIEDLSVLAEKCAKVREISKQFLTLVDE